MTDKEREAASSSSHTHQPYPYPPPPFPNGPNSSTPVGEATAFPPAATSSRSGEVIMTSTLVGQSPGQVTPQSVGGFQYWSVMPRNVGGVGNVAVVAQDGVIPPPKDKSLLEAYLLGLPLGFLGAHHFYLGRPAFGVMYLLTLGLLGIGWFIDLLRMPCLVAQVNKGNRERHDQLQQLKQQLLLQQQQQQQQYGGVAAVPVGISQLNVVFLPFEPRSLCDAYILWFPFGFFGFHHFYLRNYGFGVLYFFTFGLLGIGWLVDFVRMPSLVRSANSLRPQNEARSYSQGTAHVFALSPAGILGGHHFYLDRPVWGCLYLLTFGLLGVGWVFDWFRTSCLVKRANAIREGRRSPDRKYLDDAYILCLPFGFTGLHHFYLRRYGWGFLYLFTLGILGIGWLIDWCRLPSLVKDCNNNFGLTQPLIAGGGVCAAGNGNDKGNGSGSSGNTNVAINVGSGSQPQVMATSPQFYPPQPPPPPPTGYGYHYNTMVYPPLPPPDQGPAPGYYAPAASQGAVPPSYEASVEGSKPDDKN